jgi:hypothetical protein
MTNNTVRRFPRTCEEAFGPNRIAITGPYRRPSRVFARAMRIAGVVVVAAMLAAMAGA